MTTRTLGEVPTGCRERLIAHYGAKAQEWLDAVPEVLGQMAERWRLTLAGYHDAGHASVIATAADLDGRPLILKAWADPTRYQHEVCALRLWAGELTVDVMETADDQAVALLEMVGGRPGGSDWRQRETQMVAGALHGLHLRGRAELPEGSLPLLGDYLRFEVLPRIEKRALRLDLGPWQPLADDELRAITMLQEDPRRSTVLHGDLYRENVPFDGQGHPRLIDPVPMVGDAAFDWAFWTVYYDLGRETSQRLATAARISRIPVPVIAPWCRLLSLDGLLYYVDTDDPRAPQMFGVLSFLSVRGAGGDV
ncbi:aminoglycoside phosphotransferase family protein [Streptomyces corynorhini]|uniref:Phosphotransferase n=1 Tax=Streptomyces corynorhini TaxID=2282652 RepID=A0A370AYW3_9ACTN|nr:aminoglycoside phosphotransferase family protein [Streptomyces corynorhini]RDG34770.1 phosphotransferase [Streptomyces corynorhini]